MSTDLTQSLGAFVRSASGKTTRSSSPMEFWTGLSGLIVDNIADNWDATTKPYQAGRQEHYFPAEFLTRETAALFLDLLMMILKPGGRAALVLPDGTLFGEGVKTRIKESLLAECNLHTIVRLPNGVFSPYTSIRTNLLFFTKGQPTQPVWYYEHPYPPVALHLPGAPRSVRASGPHAPGRRARRVP